jgi:hypothetical protein
MGYELSWFGLLLLVLLRPLLLVSCGLGFKLGNNVGAGLLRSGHMWGLRQRGILWMVPIAGIIVIAVGIPRLSGATVGRRTSMERRRRGWKVRALDLRAIGVQSRRWVPEKRRPELTKLVGLVFAFAGAGSDVGIGPATKTLGVPVHRIKSLVRWSGEESVQVWLLLRRHAGVEEWQSAGDPCEHCGVLERQEAE